MELRIVDKCQLALQAYDKGQLTEPELEQVMEIDFQTGIFSGAMNMSLYECERMQILMQLSDKQLVSEDVIRRQVFGIERTK
jgi:hypothetical protein